MLEALSKILELAPRLSAPLLLTCVALLFLPDRWVEILGLETLRSEYRPWIGGVAVLCFFITMFDALKWGRSILSGGWLAQRKERKRVLFHLDSLNDSERKLFAAMLLAGQQTIYAPLVNSTAHGLVAKGLLRRAQGNGNGAEWPATIPSFVWDALRQRCRQFVSDDELSDEECRRSASLYLHRMKRSF